MVEISMAQCRTEVHMLRLLGEDITVTSSPVADKYGRLDAIITSITRLKCCSAMRCLVAYPQGLSITVQVYGTPGTGAEWRHLSLENRPMTASEAEDVLELPQGMRQTSSQRERRLLLATPAEPSPWTVHWVSTRRKNHKIHCDNCCALNLPTAAKDP